MAKAMMKALERKIRVLDDKFSALGLENALDELDEKHTLYNQSVAECAKAATKCERGAKLVDAVYMLCDPDSYQFEIAEAKTFLEDNAAKSAIIAEQAVQKVGEIHSTYPEYMLRADAESAEAEEAARFAAIGSLDKVEADKLKVRVNEIAESYHEEFTLATHNYTISRKELAEAMATAELLLNA